MCVNLLQTAGMAGSSLVEAGGNLQMAASGLDALGDLASGVTRARMNRADARAEEATAQARAKRIRSAGEAELGQARAQASASGVSLSSGSVLAAERQIVQNVEQDALSAILTGRNRADALRRSASAYQAAGIGSAADTLTGGFGRWKRTRRNSAFRLDDPYRVPGYFGGEEGE
jgi:hypothetical protein